MVCFGGGGGGGGECNNGSVVGRYDVLLDFFLCASSLGRWLACVQRD